eukprot:TRINITY_DN1074_c0_g1_i9.p2 TRINITY_DN1074_c0_g1~~TRINITY_DN1074_c0_g1_i9.p2  ORF type:complete len:104 (+),score=15.27 TRINITY_DN1074_c0_g1_i9:961-1272(+)
MDEVRDAKTLCLHYPEQHLWCGTTQNMPEIHNIFHKIKQLQYGDRPDYEYIREQLLTLLQREEGTHPSADTKSTPIVFVWVARRRGLRSPSARLKTLRSSSQH